MWLIYKYMHFKNIQNLKGVVWILSVDFFSWKHENFLFDLSISPKIQTIRHHNVKITRNSQIKSCIFVKSQGLMFLFQQKTVNSRPKIKIPWNYHFKRGSYHQVAPKVSSNHTFYLYFLSFLNKYFLMSVFFYLFKYH